MNPLLIISDYLLADRRILSRDLILNLTLTLCSYLNSNSYSISPHVLQFSGGPRTTQIIVPLVVSTPSWRKLPPTITSIVTVSARPVWQERNQNQNWRHSNSNLTKPWKSSFSSGFLAFQCVGITQVMGGVNSGGSLPMSVLKGHHPLETPPWPGHKESALYAAFWLTGDQGSWRNKSRRLWRGCMQMDQPANAGDTGWISGSGRVHMPQGNWALCHNYWAHELQNLRSPTKEVTMPPTRAGTAIRSPKLLSSPASPQLAKAHAQRQRPSVAKSKNQWINKLIKWNKKNPQKARKTNWQSKISFHWEGHLYLFHSIWSHISSWKFILKIDSVFKFVYSKN